MEDFQKEFFKQSSGGDRKMNGRYSEENKEFGDLSNLGYNKHDFSDKVDEINHFREKMEIHNLERGGSSDNILEESLVDMIQKSSIDNEFEMNSSEHLQKEFSHDQVYDFEPSDSTEKLILKITNIGRKQANAFSFLFLSSGIDDSDIIFNALQKNKDSIIPELQPNLRIWFERIIENKKVSEWFN